MQASRISRTQSTDAALAAIGHAVLKSKNEMTSVVSDPCGYFRCRVHRGVAVRLCRCCDPGSSAADECRFRPGMGLQGHSEKRADLRQEAEPLIRDLLPQQISEPARCRRAVKRAGLFQCSHFPIRTPPRGRDGCGNCAGRTAPGWRRRRPSRAGTALRSGTPVRGVRRSGSVRDRR
jgi:hypothetical protein